MDRNEAIEIPFGAFDSELKGWEYTIPEGYVARIEGNKIILEPKESEDERIRKEIIGFLNAINKDTLEGRNFIADRYGDAIPDDMIPTWIAWLEKQGSQNIANSAKTCKDEPKFKVGDWVISDEAHQDYRNCLITDIEDNKYYIKSNEEYKGFNYFDDLENFYRLWTIQDAKDGDVLIVRNIVFIYKRILSSHIVSYCKLINNIFEPVNDARTFCEGNPYVHPATKEQRNLLFQKMKEAGYEWDAEKKELKKIEQNPAWSKEDDDMTANGYVKYPSKEFF